MFDLRIVESETEEEGRDATRFALGRAIRWTFRLALYLALWLVWISVVA